MYLVLNFNLCLINMTHVTQSMRGFLCLYWLFFNSRKCHEKTTVSWNILDIKISLVLVLFCMSKHTEAFGQIHESWLNLFSSCGTEFFFDLFLNCFSCKALQSSARHHSLCCSPLGNKKSASVSQNLVKYSETTKEIALCMNPARDHCVRQFNLWKKTERRHLQNNFVATTECNRFPLWSLLPFLWIFVNSTN